jgi:osmotically-inducible protein OsmY
MTIVLSTAVVQAADPSTNPAPWTAPARPDLGDCMLSLSIRQILQQDEGLMDFNLGVSVRAGVATLWGAVPSADLSRRAEGLVRQIPHVGGVRNELRVEPVAPLKADAPPWFPIPRQPPLFPDGLPAGALASRPPGAAPRGEASQWRPQGQLASTVAGPAAGTMPAAPTPPVVLLRPVEARETPSLIVRIDRLRQRDDRFRAIHLQVQGGLVTLGGIVAHADDLYEFARQVAHVPGVERIILDSTSPLAFPRPVPNGKR